MSQNGVKNKSKKVKTESKQSQKQSQKRVKKSSRPKKLKNSQNRVNPLIRPHESRKVLQRELTEVLEAQQQPGQWQYLWETPEICRVCHTETNTDQPIRKCTSCYRQVHYVCLQNDDQATYIPVCRACASGPDPQRKGSGVTGTTMPTRWRTKCRSEGRCSRGRAPLGFSGGCPVSHSWHGSPD